MQVYILRKIKFFDILYSCVTYYFIGIYTIKFEKKKRLTACSYFCYDWKKKDRLQLVDIVDELICIELPNPIKFL